MNKEKLSKTISLLMHQNLYVVNNGTKENPDFVVGGTELLNKELTKLFSLYGVVSSSCDCKKHSIKTNYGFEVCTKCGNEWDK